MKTVSLKLPDALVARLEAAIARRRKTRSELMREALEAYLASHPEVQSGSFLALNHDLAGAVKGPRDLSKNAAYLADFGR
jgi:Arc/MetJ-type ribon-helix-helix transcriptional regulator